MNNYLIITVLSYRKFRDRYKLESFKLALEPLRFRRGWFIHPFSLLMLAFSPQLTINYETQLNIGPTEWSTTCYYLIIKIDNNNEISVGTLRPVNLRAIILNCWCVVTRSLAVSTTNSTEQLYSYFSPLISLRYLIWDLNHRWRLFPSRLKTLASWDCKLINNQSNSEVHIHR